MLVRFSHPDFKSHALLYVRARMALGLLPKLSLCLFRGLGQSRCPDLDATSWEGAHVRVDRATIQGEPLREYGIRRFATDTGHACVRSFLLAPACREVSDPGTARGHCSVAWPRPEH